MKPIQLALPLIFAASVTLAENGVPGSHFIENWDLDGDGQVTLAEAQERRGDVFYSFDADEDGYIDEEESVKGAKLLIAMSMFEQAEDEEKE